MQKTKSFSLIYLGIIPLIIMLACLPLFSALDLKISRFFYREYPGFNVPTYIQLIYQWGNLPALFTGISALVLLLVNIRPVWQKYRTAALMIFLTLVIAPGLVINLGLKGSFQRPRPVQVIEFGGKYEYASITQMKFKMHNYNQRSFPSGHTSMGFFFLALWRVAIREKKVLFAKACLLFAFLSTFLLSYARIAQGGHFLSDILFSGLITWLTILVLEWYCYGHCSKKETYTSCT